MMLEDINVPIAPNSIIVMKLRKNCFFFTWNLKENGKKKKRIFCYQPSLKTWNITGSKVHNAKDILCGIFKDQYCRRNKTLTIFVVEGKGTDVNFQQERWLKDNGEWSKCLEWTINHSLHHSYMIRSNASNESSLIFLASEENQGLGEEKKSEKGFFKSS